MSIIVTIITSLYFAEDKTQADIQIGFIVKFGKDCSELINYQLRIQFSYSKVEDLMFPSKRFWVNKKVLHTVEFVPKFLICLIAHDCVKVNFDGNGFGGLFLDLVKSLFYMRSVLKLWKLSLHSLHVFIWGNCKKLLRGFFTFLHMTESMCIAVQLSKFFFHYSQLHNERFLEKRQNPREIRTCSLPIARHKCWPLCHRDVIEQSWTVEYIRMRLK